MKKVYEHDCYDILVCGETRALFFKWKPASAAVTEDQFKDSLLKYGDLMFEHEMPHMVVDLRDYRGRIGMDIAMGWRNESVVPRYNQAGIEKFAYLVDPALPGPPVSAPRVSAPEIYPNAVFDDEAEMLGWLTNAVPTPLRGEG